MTLENLARMTQRGFTGVDRKIDGFRRGVDIKFGDLRREMDKFATKAELRETEEHLLDAIRGIEVRRHEFEELQTYVEILGRRIVALEKKV